MQFSPLSERRAHLQIYGDVQTVLQGKVDSSMGVAIPLQTLRFGLGAMRGTGETEYGDGMVYENRGHLTVMQDGTERLITHTERIHTPFFMGIGSEAAPAERATFSFDAPRTLDSLYEVLEGRAEYGLAFAGTVHFSSLCGAYLKRSPIHNELINENRALYWHPEESRVCAGHIFGVIITQEGQRAFPKQELAKAFYTNPGDRASAHMSHTHVLKLKNGTGDIQTVYHLLSHSQIVSGELFLYHLCV